MISNPFLPAPAAAAAWAEGFVKGFTGLAGTGPSGLLGPFELGAFTAGESAGVTTAVEGIAFADPCVPAAEEHGPGHVPEIVVAGAEILHGVWEARHLAALAAGLAGVIVGAFELLLALPVHIRPPEDVLPELIQPIVDRLAAFGLDSTELFVGAGLDGAVADCEIMLTAIFPAQESAKQAAKALGRPSWLVARWRTDMSNSFAIVDSS